MTPHLPRRIRLLHCLVHFCSSQLWVGVLDRFDRGLQHVQRRGNPAVVICVKCTSSGSDEICIRGCRAHMFVSAQEPRTGGGRWTTASSGVPGVMYALRAGINVDVGGDCAHRALPCCSPSAEKSPSPSAESRESRNLAPAQAKVGERKCRARAHRPSPHTCRRTWCSGSWTRTSS